MERAKQRQQERLDAKQEKKQHKNWSVSDIAQAPHEAIDHLLYLHSTRLSEEIESFYKKLLKVEEIELDLLHTFGKIADHFGRAEKAIEIFMKALAVDSTFPIYGSLASAFMHAGQDEPAEVCFKVATVKNPRDANLYWEFSKLLVKKGELDEANNQLIQAEFIDPQHTGVLASLAKLHITRKNASKALETIEKGLAVEPSNNLLIALKSIALSNLDNETSFRELYDYETLITESIVDLSPLSQDTQQFMDSLAHHLKSTSPDGDASDSHAKNSPAAGKDGENLLERSTQEIQTLDYAISEAIRKHITRLPRKLDHAHIKHLPEDYQVFAWHERINQANAVTSELAEHSWLSGVLFVECPKEKAVSGCGLVLGEGPEEYYEKNTCITQLVEPAIGKMITFPSYMWQRFEPLKSDESMLVVRFDVIPYKDHRDL